MNIRSRYAIMLIVSGSLTIVFGATLKVQGSPYANLLFLSGLALSFVGTIIFVINMYHKR